MSIVSKVCIRSMAIVGVSAIALVTGQHIATQVSGGLVEFGTAYAQGHDGGSGGHSSGGGGSGGKGYRGGKGTTAAPGGSGGGQGGPSDDSDAKGPKYQGGTGGDTGSGGGKPVWAQEGIPEVELGRLNVVRAPAKVIDKALAEALANFDPAKSAALYSMSAEDFANFVKANFDTITMVDSPLENLGLYKDIVADGITQLSNVTPSSKVDLAAIVLGSASDKTVALSTDSVIAVTKILGLTLTDAEVSAIAAKAEIVRQAILEGHG